MFEEALTDILSRLEAAKAQGLVQAFALIGGFAVSAWGIPRATQAIDFAVETGGSDPQDLARFLGGHFKAGEVDDPLMGVVHVSIQVYSTNIPIQLILFPSVLTEIAFRDITSLSILEHVVPIVSWQALMLLKLYAVGPQDLLDAQQILQVRRPQPEELEPIQQWAESLGILKEWVNLLSFHQRETSDS